MRIVIGKIICGVVGLLMYGPAGLILGLVIGQLFDNGLRNVMYSPTHTEQVRAIFFKSVFEIMGYIAKSDGRVTEKEIQTVREIMLHDFNLTAEQMRVAIGYFNYGKNPAFNSAYTLTRFKSTCAPYPALTRFFLELIVKAAVADGDLSETKRGRLMKICNTLGIQIAELEYQLSTHGFYAQQQKAQGRQYSQGAYSGYQKANETNYNSTNKAEDELSAAYRLLGVKPSDDLKVIKTAYRKLISQYHPDKLVSKGLPQEMMEIAKRKAQQITVAHDLIVRSRE